MKRVNQGGDREEEIQKRSKNDTSYIDTYKDKFSDLFEITTLYKVWRDERDPLWVHALYSVCKAKKSMQEIEKIRNGETLDLVLHCRHNGGDDLSHYYAFSISFCYGNLKMIKQIETVKELMTQSKSYGLEKTFKDPEEEVYSLMSNIGKYMVFAFDES